MAIPVLEEPARRVVVIPILVDPPAVTTQDWSYSTGGVVLPTDVLRQRNERIVAWFGGLIFPTDATVAGEAIPLFYSQDGRRHTPLEALAIRSDATVGQSFIAGPLDVTELLPPAKQVGVRAYARSTVEGQAVLFYHLALTFMVQ